MPFLRSALPADPYHKPIPKVMNTIKHVLCLSLLFGALAPVSGQLASKTGRSGKKDDLLVAANNGHLALRISGFEENKGQVVTTSGQPAPFVRYHLGSGNTNIYLLEAGIAYQFTRLHAPDDYVTLHGRLHRTPDEEARLKAAESQAELETYRMDMILEGANEQAPITTEGRSGDFTNYYRYGALEVHAYGKVVYHDIYPGIDWSIHTTTEGIEYDFLVHPGADPSLIKLRFKHHEELSLDTEGKLTHGNRLGRFTEAAPVSYQGEFAIPTRFHLSDDLLTFDVGDYDRSIELLIDPPRLWGTYYGGSDFDASQSVDLDANGNVYLAGWTRSTNAIATVGAQQTAWVGDDDAMLVKFNPSGVRQWGTYYGGSLSDAFAGCVVSGNSIYAAGNTNSTSGVATGDIHQSTLGGDQDGLLVKFNTNNGTRAWATYYGGPAEDRARACAVDGGGNVYLAGFAMSDQGIALSEFVHQGTFGGGSTGQSYSRGDGFLAKFAADGFLSWGTYYGGASDDEITGVAVDWNDDVYIGGGTGTSGGTSIATLGSHQATIGGNADAFLAKLSSNCFRLWGTYYGGTNADYAFACAVDSLGYPYLVGDTYSTNAIASGGHQNTFGGNSLRDAFLVKFNSVGTRQWGTYYGGSDTDTGRGCTTEGNGNVYLIGETVSTNAIAFNGHQMTNGGGEVDGYLAGFTSTGTRTLGTYYGGSMRDEAYSATVDYGHNIYLCGRTLSTNAISTAGSHQPAYGGVSDAFLVKFGDLIDCQGVPNGTALPGTACNDQDACTSNDTWSNECVCSGTAVPGPSMGTVGGNSPLCVGDVLNLTAAATGIGTITYLWSGPNAFGSGAQNPTINNVTVAAAGTYNVAASNGCGTDAVGSIQILVNPQPTTATVGGAQTICVNTTTTGLGGNTPQSGTGAWSVVSGGTGTFSNAAAPNATFTHTGGVGPVIVRWTISLAPCVASSANVTITIKQPTSTAITGAPQTICTGGTTAGLGGNTPTSGTGQWTVVSGGAGIFNPDQATGNATFTPNQGTGPYLLRWTTSNAPCEPDTADVLITMNPPPSTATVGNAQTICANGTTAGLGGNTPLIGTGGWSVVSGGTGTFSNATSPNATFTHTGGAGPVIARWTISNAPCAPSTGDVTITINQGPTTATVGGAQTICVNGTTTGLGGNTPTSGTGAWSLVSGGTGTFSNATLPNSTFTHTGGAGPVIVRWTISNAPCTASIANVTITINQPPSAATVGGPQTICTNGTTTGLGGNTPTTGTGAWSVVSGGTGTFSNAALPNSTFTHTGGAGPVIVRWTISNAPCTAATANVTITINQGPTTATVGGAQTICANGTTTGLGGNTPTSGTGAWSVVSGGTGTFSNATSPNATFTHTGGTGPVVVRWTISNAPCPASTANVSITITQPPSAATVGGAQTICGGGTTTGLGGNSPTTGTGAWSVVSGGTGTFSNAAAPNATFTHTGGTGPVVVRWTISNAPCTASTANVTITVNPAPTAATVGGPQTICNGGTTTGLGGNTPTTGTGTWSIVSGGTGTFANAGLPNSTFTHTGGAGPVVLRWTISSAPCTASTANVTITINQTPSTATVGGAQTVCANGTTTGLGGNTPVTGTGTWSVVSGGTGTFSNAATPNATFTHTGGTGPVVVRWTISNAPCTASSAQVTITISQPPTAATVGGPQTICANGTTSGLGGNTPTIGTGAWSVVSGGTGTFSNASSPTATFTHASGAGPVIVRWTISQAPCTASTANVTITINQPPTTATTGGPQTTCTGGTTSALGANTPSVGTGSWSVVSGGTGTFSNAGSPNSTFTHTGGAGPILLRWTISNAPCTATSANVSITINQAPTVATVGGPQTLCVNGTTSGLGGNTPSIGTGAWSVVSGGTGTFANAASPNTTFTHMGGTGPVIVRWTISNAPCAASTANVSITINQPPSVATAGTVQPICANGTTTGLGGNSPLVGSGTWSVVSGGTGTFAPNAGAPNATFTHTGGTGPVVVRWTINNVPCTATTANVTVTISPDSDGDGVCDVQDDCPSVPGELGSPCDDANDLTINDVLITDCICQGTPVSCVEDGDCNDGDACTLDDCVSNACVYTPITTDTDGDGIPNCSDDCPNVAGEVGSTCNDNNPCTINDALNAACNCVGTASGDTDGDGICDAVDECPDVSGGIGSGCDDNDACTIDDVLNSSCVCTGTFSGDTDADGICDATDDCPTVPGEVGSPCSDGDLCTINDILNAACDCTGTFDNGDTDGDGIPNCEDDCPNVAGEQGSPCDDNNPCTTNDVLNVVCNCAGSDAGDIDNDGICDPEDDCPAIPGEIGDACDDDEPCTIDDVLNADCQCTGTNTGDSDGDGVCDEIDDCPDVAGQVGGPCDDGNVCTLNDVLNSGCLCTGTPDNTDTDGDAIPDCADSCPTIPGQVGGACDDNNPCTIGDILNPICQCAGSPDNTDSDDDGEPDCSDDCPDLPGQIGDACDDGSALTVEDAINGSCVCIGIPVSCSVNGDCDDQDACTTDICDNNTCVYTQLTTDDDGDGVPNCADPCPDAVGVPGNTCDDNNPCTIGDILNPACQCAGSPDNTDTDGDGIPNCDDSCPTTAGQVGSPCDDNDPLTINDELDGSCVCIGIPVSCAVDGDCDDNDDCTSDACVANACVFTPLTTDTDGDDVLDCIDLCPTVFGEPGSPCDDGNPCTLNDLLNPSCGCAGAPDNTDTDVDGIPDCEDSCPEVAGEAGSACNDNNACTTGDILSPACVCAGTPILVGPINGPASVSGFTTQNYSVPVIPGATYVWTLPDFWSSSNTTSSSLSVFVQQGPDTEELCVNAYLPGCSDLDPACITITLLESVGIDDHASEAVDLFTVRPNPSRGIFELVRTRAGGDAEQLEVRDANGRLIPVRVLRAGQRVSSLDMGDASPGAYFLRASNGTEIQVIRLLVQR